MTQPIEAVLTDAQKATLEIEQFIFHIIQAKEGDEGKAELEVVHLDEVPLTPSQKKFFIERLKDSAQGTQFVYQPEAVTLKNKCELLVSTPDQFVTLSKQIATDFSGHHAGQMSPGVFVVALVKFLAAANEYKRLVFLVKMDQSVSYPYSWKEINGKRVAEVGEIGNALNENKKAIQKTALVDVSGHFAWDALAYDRVNSRVGDFFRKFLGVVERQQDSSLTRTAHSVVKRWASTLPPEDLAEGEDANSITGRAVNYLTDRDTFDTDEYLRTIIRDADEERKARLMQSLKDALAEKGVAGQQFTPKPGSLKKGERQQRYQTEEGVTIIFEGTPEAAGITRSSDSNGQEIITIRTSKLRIPLKT